MNSREPGRAPSEPWADVFDWFTFVCPQCANEVNVSRSEGISPENFATMILWIYGDPPMCVDCLRPELNAEWL